MLRVKIEVDQVSRIRNAGRDIKMIAPASTAWKWFERNVEVKSDGRRPSSVKTIASGQQKRSSVKGWAVWYSANNPIPVGRVEYVPTRGSTPISWWSRASGCACRQRRGQGRRSLSPPLATTGGGGGGVGGVSQKRRRRFRCRRRHRSLLSSSLKYPSVVPFRNAFRSLTANQAQEDPGKPGKTQ